MPSFTITLNSFAITNTRSVHNDTDYVCLGLNVNGIDSKPVAQRVGDVNNGTHQVNLSISHPLLDLKDRIAFSYLIINHGGGKTEDVLLHCEAAVTLTPLKTFTPSDTQPSKQIQRTSAYLNNFWNEIQSQFKNVSSDHCDGPVAIDRFSFLGSSVAGLASESPFNITYPGIDSATFCGSNSHYSVEWSIAHTL